MKKYIMLVLVCSILLLLASCGNKTYINIVKETTLKGESYTVGHLIDAIAGKNGEVNWVIVKQKDQPNLVTVDVEIKTADKANEHIVQMQYFLNTDKDHVRLIKKEIDGKTLTPMAWALQISRIIMESKSH
ncbi:MAG: hypothetical protein PHF25_08285 [Candidatus Margulisbacteria bacterium]|nr:hypothetical protein [Candidatus Margulisiibacteriota bacterium]